MEVQEERKPKSLLTKTVLYFKKNGAKKGLKKIHNKFFRLETVSYERWRRGAMPSEHELARQRRESASWKQEAAREKEERSGSYPLFCIVVPMYHTPPGYLEELIASVQGQTYENWQLCLADGSETPCGRFGGERETDPRICYRFLGENKGIAGNTNEALSMARGDYVVLADHDDLLTADALYSLARAVREEPEADLLYSDEDKTDARGKKYYDPHFKPDFNEDLLRSVNYICHLLAVRRSLAQEAGGFLSGFDGAQDYDFIFRCAERARRIVHIPKILYHWRCHEASTSENPESKRYAFEAGQRAIEAHYGRLGIRAQVSGGVRPGMYVTRYERSRDPLVSVLIPNKDHGEDLERTIRSVLSRTSYRELEWIILENNSTQEETFVLYERLKKELKNVRILTWEGEFNYSAINNFGASQASGEYLWLLNNDLEMITDDCVDGLLNPCMRPEIGIVGARLYYGDNTIQHAGVIVGLGGVAGHAFVGQPRFDCGYMGRDWCTQRLSAVTAACLMIRRSVFEEIGGFSEELAVAFNDVDLCLKAGEAGYGVLYNAQVEAYHYESKTRGLENTPEKIARFNGEMDRFKEKWEGRLRAGDPYYNINLTLARNDFTLRNPYEIDYEQRIK
ncbi:MAG: glycosyltransferase family 2 protein [Lachnospiraceae bacterium]|nr:glycosyltransferase family 2 protein [Lachnospiraceae bacterium]